MHQQGAAGLGALGLPVDSAACLFDLDGVLTQTAAVHRAAWKQTFDPLLERLGQEPFTLADYLQYVDGKRRLDGVRTFLTARGIHVPEGGVDDPPEADTVGGIGNRKNVLVLRELEEHGVDVYPGSVTYLRAVRDAGLPIGVVTASANAEAVLDAAHLSDFVDARVDGLVAAARGLRGKPAPDTFLAAAAALEVPPAQAVVFEDALAGVAAGRAGGFGYVVGVDRADQAEALRQHGASIVVTDLVDLLRTAHG